MDSVAYSINSSLNWYVAQHKIQNNRQSNNSVQWENLDVSTELHLEFDVNDITVTTETKVIHCQALTTFTVEQNVTVTKDSVQKISSDSAQTATIKFFSSETFNQSSPGEPFSLSNMFILLLTGAEVTELKIGDHITSCIELDYALASQYKLNIENCTFTAQAETLSLVENGAVPGALSSLISLRASNINRQALFDFHVFQLGESSQATFSCDMLIDTE